MAKRTVGRVLKTDGTIQRIYPEKGNKFSLKELQNVVGGLIEPFALKPGNGRGRAYANEEGLLQGLPYNSAASKIAVVGHIVGDVIIVEKEDV